MLCRPDKQANAMALQRAGPINNQKGVCDGTFTADDVNILGFNCRGEKYLFT